MTAAPRHRVAFSLLAAISLWSAAAAWKEASERAAKPDEATVYEERFAPVRAALAGRQSVGYVTDLEPSLTADAEYRLLQYAIAPVVLLRSSDPGLIVGNFHTASGIARATAGLPVTMGANLGKGVFLLNRKPAK